jgi:Leucine rich repeat
VSQHFQKRVGVVFFAILSKQRVYYLNSLICCFLIICSKTSSMGWAFPKKAPVLTGQSCHLARLEHVVSVGVADTGIAGTCVQQYTPTAYLYIMRFHSVTDALRDPAHCYELDLANQNLTTLPPGMLRLTRAEQLDLRGNPALNWAESLRLISEMPSVVKLNLMDNDMVHLPAEVGLLANLQYLYLDNNRLESLPPEIGSLAQLTNLSADNNALTALPNQFFKLVGLKFLSLNRNQFAVFSPEVNRLVKLVTFHIKENPLTTEAKAALKQEVPRSVFIFGM